MFVSFTNFFDCRYCMIVITGSTENKAKTFITIDFEYTSARTSKVIEWSSWYCWAYCIMNRYGRCSSHIASNGIEWLGNARWIESIMSNTNGWWRRCTCFCSRCRFRSFEVSYRRKWKKNYALFFNIWLQKFEKKNLALLLYNRLVSTLISLNAT